MWGVLCEGVGGGEGLRLRRTLARGRRREQRPFSPKKGECRHSAEHLRVTKALSWGSDSLLELGATVRGFGETR
jgi:hypothetical protein